MHALFYKLLLLNVLRNKDFGERYQKKTWGVIFANGGSNGTLTHAKTASHTRQWCLEQQHAIYFYLGTLILKPSSIKASADRYLYV